MAKLLKPRFSPKFQKRFKKLHPSLKKKFAKQLKFMLENPRHPSLNIKKMAGSERFEGRLDYHNRFVFKIFDNEIWFYSVGPHDEGLGKK